MRLSTQVLLACAFSAFFAGCYSHTDADPAQIGFDVVFPSTAAAVWSDGVKISVFPADSTDLSSCLAAINLVTSGAQLPAPLAQSSTTACALQQGGASFGLTIGASYYVLAVASNGVNNVMAGCVREDDYGNSAPLDVPLALLDVDQAVPATSCKLSEFCSGACK